MNCKNCEYGLPWKNGDLSGVTCTYEEGECVKITELKEQIEKLQKGKGLMKEMLIALKIYARKYNVSLIKDVEKFLMN